MKKQIKEKNNFVLADAKLLELFALHKKPYCIKLFEKEWVVLPNVFSPKYSPDALYFVPNFPDIKEKSFLEIGCGTGIVCIETALKGAKKIVATDINNNAVKNTALNAKKHKVKIDARKGNLFSSIKKTEKFDVIFFNLPFGYKKKPVKKVLEKSVWDYKYKTQKNFLKKAKQHLTKKGIILIGFSTIGHIQELKNNSKKFGYKIKELFSKKIKDIEGKHTFKLYELTPKKN